MRAILTTVGTSLLTNPERPWQGWRNKQSLPEPGIVESWLLGADPIKASAETHTWYRLGLFEKGDGANVEVVLIHSQTSEGKFCAQRLVTLAHAVGMSARSVEVAGLRYSDGKVFNRGLRQLARIVGQEIQRGRFHGTVELAATGGGKAEIAIANLVGAVSDTPVHYIYQEFSSLVTIEPIPVTLRADWISNGGGRVLLEKFSNELDSIPLSEVENLLRQDERLHVLLDTEIVDNQEFVALNFLGEIARNLLNTPHESWPPATDMLPDDKNHLEKSGHHRPPGWGKVVEIITNCRYVTSVRYESAASGDCMREARDNHSDLLHYIAGNPPLRLRITTTARNPTQRRLVQKLLRKELGF